MRLPAALVSVALAAFAAMPASAQTMTRAFGHSVALHRDGAQGPMVLRVDGRTLLSEQVVRIDETAVVEGTGILVGYASSAGTNCSAAPFIVSFPKGSSARIDGPVGGCGSIARVDGDAVTVTESPDEFKDYRTWVWTGGLGLVPGPTLKWKPHEASGWDKLRSREIERPAQLIAFKDTDDQIQALLGARMEMLRPLLVGVGSGTFDGTAYVGQECQEGNCLTTGMLVYADIPTRRLYLAWRSPDFEGIQVEPRAGAWPARATKALADWKAEAR